MLTYYQQNKEKILQRNRENRDEIRQYYKKWYNSNKHNLNERRKEKIRQLEGVKNEKVETIKPKKKYTKLKNEKPEYKLTVEYEMTFN